MQFGERRGHSVGVVLDLGAEAGFGLVDEVAVVSTLDAALKPEGNQKANRDGEEMDEKVADAVNCGVRWMDFKHRGASRVELADSVAEGGIPYGGVDVYQDV